ncbi:MAG: 3-methyl-2-oxobutanoate hydroxymethyltransferase [Hyphomicrobiales bacterium]|nr:3-methyl-2-oxobutanoate hydroxymethyltransferase [Hyphomicrobiales bacterium]
MKRQGEKIAMLTAYDAPNARAQAEGGVDILLVGDSVGTNILGYASEREVTMADMVHHIAAVRRGAPEAYIVGDLPYASCATPQLAAQNAKTLRAAGADMVKFEGALPDVVRAIKAEGIAVCCHLGLEPQNHEEKRLKGKTAADAKALIDNARALDAAGMDMLVLELIPEEVARAVTQAVKAPTIGIGAGRFTDGQVLVVCDTLGYTQNNFKHNKRYADHGTTMREAAAAYAHDVHSGAFPAESNAFKMPKEEREAFGV